MEEISTSKKQRKKVMIQMMIVIQKSQMNLKKMITKNLMIDIPVMMQQI